MELLQFLLNALHEEDLKGQRQIRKKEKSKQHPYTSIIHECCQGVCRAGVAGKAKGEGGHVLEEGEDCSLNRG